MDHGKDLNSVTKLLKKLTTVEGEINKRKVSTHIEHASNSFSLSFYSLPPSSLTK